MKNLMESIPLCSAGIAKVEFPPEFRRAFRQEAEEVRKKKEEEEDAQEMAR
jgi:hypothetical protein